MLNKNVTVVYFSISGHTAAVARHIALQTNSDLVEIRPLNPYTASGLNYEEPHSRCYVEWEEADARPELVEPRAELGSTVFLGFPVWFDIAPRAVQAWIEKNDLTGRTIVPFCTSGSSEIRHAVRVLREAYPALRFEEGRCFTAFDAAQVTDFVNEHVK